MSVKNNPLPLFTLTLQKFSSTILAEWNESCYINYDGFCKELKRQISTILPPTIYTKLFHHMVDTHVRIVQSKPNQHDVPSVSLLINSLLVDNLQSLNLSSLHDIGTVSDEELANLEYILIQEIPNMSNLTEICLETRGTSTLPTCNNEIMEKIGCSCPNLRSLDISYNHTVTDYGIAFLVPNYDRTGCPKLSKLCLFQCSVTVRGVIFLLNELKQLKILKFQELGICLVDLHKQRFSNEEEKKFELTHVNTLVVADRMHKDFSLLRCDSNMASAICSTCPKLSMLGVRVCDSDLTYLEQMKTVTCLNIVYNIANASSPGINTIQYFRNNGSQLMSLTLTSDIFTTKYLKAIAEHCTHLRYLGIRCCRFICEEIFTKSDKKNCLLSNLEQFIVKVGYKENDTCTIPHSIINYVLHKSNSLKDIVLAMKNSYFSDAYIRELLRSINTSELRRFMILAPHKLISRPYPSINLSMMSVHLIMSTCPQLRHLANIWLWDISLEEIQALRRELKLINSALVLIPKKNTHTLFHPEATN